MLIKSIRRFDSAALNSNEIETFGNKKTVGSREPKQLFSPCALYRASIYTQLAKLIIGPLPMTTMSQPQSSSFFSLFSRGSRRIYGFWQPDTAAAPDPPTSLFCYFICLTRNFVKKERNQFEIQWRHIVTWFVLQRGRLVLLMEGHRPQDPTGGSINLSQDLSQIITKISGRSVFDEALNWMEI